MQGNLILTTIPGILLKTTGLQTGHPGAQALAGARHPENRRQVQSQSQRAKEIDDACGIQKPLKSSK
jgi:hypothetical protein